MNGNSKMEIFDLKSKTGILVDSAENKLEELDKKHLKCEAAIGKRLQRKCFDIYTKIFNLDSKVTFLSTKYMNFYKEYCLSITKHHKMITASLCIHALEIIAIFYLIISK